MPRFAMYGLLSLSFVTTSCATLLKSGPSHLSLTVEPATAITRVAPDHGRTTVAVTGSTNTLLLDRRHDYVLHISAISGGAQDVTIGRKVGPAFWGDVAALASGLALGLAKSGEFAGAMRDGGSAQVVYLYGLTAGLLAACAPIIVDATTGAMWEHDPQSVAVKLMPATAEPEVHRPR
jgi:hypothetical protein